VAARYFIDASGIAGVRAGPEVKEKPVRVVSPLRRALVVVALVVGAAGATAGPAAAARPAPHCDSYRSMYDTWSNLAIQAWANNNMAAAQTYNNLANQVYSWMEQSGCAG
jgi:hypothetical protein